MRVGQPYHDNRGILTPGPPSFVTFTKYVRPVCLPCMEDSCVATQLRNKGILTGTESSTERCRKEGNVSPQLRQQMIQSNALL